MDWPSGSAMHYSCKHIALMEIPMKATDFVAEQLLGENDPYGAKYKGQPKVTVTFRLPVEQVAWLDVLRNKGLGDSRNEVIQILLDVAIEQVSQLGVCGDESDLTDLVQVVKEEMQLKITETR